MVTRLSHTSLFVNDQDKAYDFYVKKLGFNVHTDAKMDNGFRWLTVTAPQAPDHEIVLFPANTEMNGFDQEVRDALKVLLDKGVMGAGVLETNDCRATYEELKAKGVQFTQEPDKQPWGTFATIVDPDDNKLLLVETPKKS